MKIKSFNTILLAILLAVAQPMQAGFFDSIWSGIKSFGSWIQENKGISLIVIGSLLGTGIVYGYLSKEENDDQNSSETKKNDIFADKEKKRTKAKDISTLPTNSKKRSPLLDVFPIFNVHKTKRGSKSHKEDIPDALWTNKILPCLDMTKYLPPLKYSYAEATLTIKHTHAVNTAVFNRDATRILTACDDNTAKIWNIEGNPLATLPHGNKVNSAVFNHDETHILTASDDHTAKLWDATNGNLIITLPHDSFVKKATFSHNGEHIVTTNFDDAKVWDINGNPLLTIPHNRWVNSAVFNRDGTRILTACDDNTAKLWDINGNLIRAFPHNDSVNSAVFNHNDTCILTACNDKTNTLWDINGNLITSSQSVHFTRSPTFNQSGNLIINTTYKGNLQDLDNNQLATFDSNDLSLAAAISHDSKKILITNNEGKVMLWDLTLFSKKFTPEQAAWIWLCKEQYDKNKKTVSFEAIAKKFAQDKVTTKALNETLQTFTDNEQDVLIRSFNIVDPNRSFKYS